MLLYYYCNQTILCEQTLGDSEKKEVLLNRKRPGRIRFREEKPSTIYAGV